MFWKNYRLMRSCKNSTKRSWIPVTQLPPVVTWYHVKTTKLILAQQYWLNTDLIRIALPFICTDFFFLGVFIVLWNFITCIDSCGCPDNQDMELFHHTKVPIVLHFHNYTLSLPSHSHSSILHLYNFISKLYKLSCIVCSPYILVSLHSAWLMMLNTSPYAYVHPNSLFG